MHAPRLRVGDYYSETESNMDEGPKKSDSVRGNPVQGDAASTLESKLREIRTVRRIPLLVGVCLLPLGAIPALFQETAARAALCVLFPATALAFVISALIAMTTACPACGKAFFWKMFVEANIFRNRCIHCGVSLKPPRIGARTESTSTPNLDKDSS